MRTIIVLRGLPASGKSTWAREQLKKEPMRWKRVNKDELRKMIDNSVYSIENESLIHELHSYIIKKALLCGKDILVDNTNLGARNYKKICKIAEGIGDTFVQTKTFNVSVDECIRRDALRGIACVGENVIRNFAERYSLDNWYVYGFESKSYFKPNRLDNTGVLPQNETLPKAIICDLDGTLALFNKIGIGGVPIITHLNTHVRDPYDASTCDKDSINEPVLNLIRMCASNRSFIFVSGREDKHREQTEVFLHKHVRPYVGVYSLFMRETGDQRSDTIVKEEIFINNILDKYYVDFILDDRNKVVKMWRELGLTVFQVAEGDF